MTSSREASASKTRKGRKTGAIKLDKDNSSSSHKSSEVYIDNLDTNEVAEKAQIKKSKSSSARILKGPRSCQIEGCGKDLKMEENYYQRYRVCAEHLKVLSIVVNGILSRFCQQCGKFHPLTDFDGDKRSCRARLNRHNARRRREGGYICNRLARLNASKASEDSYNLDANASEELMRILSSGSVSSTDGGDKDKDDSSCSSDENEDAEDFFQSQAIQTFHGNSMAPMEGVSDPAIDCLLYAPQPAPTVNTLQENGFAPFCAPFTDNLLMKGDPNSFFDPAPPAFLLHASANALNPVVSPHTMPLSTHSLFPLDLQGHHPPPTLEAPPEAAHVLGETRQVPSLRSYHAPSTQDQMALCPSLLLHRSVEGSVSSYAPLTNDLHQAFDWRSISAPSFALSPAHLSGSLVHDHLHCTASLMEPHSSYTGPALKDCYRAEATASDTFANVPFNGHAMMFEANRMNAMHAAPPFSDAGHKDPIGSKGNGIPSMGLWSGGAYHLPPMVYDDSNVVHELTRRRTMPPTSRRYCLEGNPLVPSYHASIGRNGDRSVELPIPELYSSRIVPLEINGHYAMTETGYISAEGDGVYSNPSNVNGGHPSEDMNTIARNR